MNRLLIVGHSPSSKPYCPNKGNPTINRLNYWLDCCGIGTYSFINMSSAHIDSLKNCRIDARISYLCNLHYRVVALGNEVSYHLGKMGVEHLQLPHPSPRNRKFNDKNFEPKVINSLQKYLGLI